MRIAINTRLLIPGKLEGIGWYTYEVVKRLVEEHPDDDFVLFFDRKADTLFDFGPNVKSVVLKPQPRHPLLFKIWFNYSIRRYLKRNPVDVFFSPDGFLSLTSKVKQVPVIHDINFEHHPEDLPVHFRKYYKKYFPRFARKAKHILTVSNYSKEDIAKTYGIDPDKITVAWNGVSELFKPSNEVVKTEIQKEYTSGMPYFLFVGALHPRKNLRRLIEAYTLLKERNPDHPFHLVIVGEELWKNAANDLIINDGIKPTVHFTGRLEPNKLAKVMSSADIFVFIPYFEGFGIPLVEAMRSGTPIISGNRTSLPEVAGEAAVYCDPFDVEDISDKLDLLSADKDLQETLRQKGLKRAEMFSWDETAEIVYSVLRKVHQ